jgi:hypothetical protein
MEGVMRRKGTLLIYCYRLFGIRQRECLVSDGIGGLVAVYDDYSCGYLPPHYPVPAIPLTLWIGKRVRMLTHKHSDDGIGWTIVAEWRCD